VDIATPPHIFRPAFLVNFSSIPQLKCHSRFFRLLGNAYSVISKVGITRAYASENEEQVESFDFQRIDR